MSVRVGAFRRGAAEFPAAAKQLARTTRNSATTSATPPEVIRKKAQRVVAEMPDWEALRESGHAIKEHTLRHLDSYLEQFEAACTAGGRPSSLGARCR